MYKKRPLRTTLQFQEKGGGPTANLNINKRRVQIKGGGGGGGGMTIVLGQKWQPAISNYRDCGEGSCLTISHTCLPSHLFAFFAFLMFSVFSFQEK